ncbi:MAG: transglutaminase-like domain-containing protein [Thermoguttaceae bacterium]
MRIRTMHGSIVYLCLLAAGLAYGHRCLAEEPETCRLLLPAEEAFQQGQGAWDVRLHDGGSVGLYDRVLIEDDGPGIGADASWMKTNRASTTEIAGDTRVKKVLHVRYHQAKDAWLYAPNGVAIEINGLPVEFSPGTPFHQVSVSLLKDGDNEVVLYCRGPARQSIKYAAPEDILRNAPERKDRPRRSFTSRDGGKTWKPLKGEYMVRLHLVQYVPQGHFISPVIDLGRDRPQPAARGDRPLLTPASIESVVLEADAATPGGTHVELAFRTGRSPVYEAVLWTDWQPASAAVHPGHRYLQWKAVLASGDPLQTPLLRSVAVEAKVSRQPTPAWAGTLKTVAFHNEQIRYTSMPFEYEDPLHPRLVALRRKYKLDAVVSGSASETEQLVKLCDWVSRQWKYQPPAVNYPAWDADEILRRKYGFCVQYAVVLMQSAISLGHQARFVFGHNPGGSYEAGHEVCEVWSNEHCKWIFLDSNLSLHCIDPKTNVPMSMLELHDLLVRTYYHGQPATLANRPQERQLSDAIAICFGSSMLPGIPPVGTEARFEGGRYSVPTRWLCLSYLPRNNFYAHACPQPITQGCSWDWSEYWWWEDAVTPRQWLYHLFTSRRNDLDWSINQVCFAATVTDRPGELAIMMGTFTPYFENFLVQLDYQDWKASSRAFTWALHPGRNRMEMRVRNNSGVLGPVSFLEVER